MSKHTNAIIAAVAVAAAMAAAWWTFRRVRTGGAIVPASSLYHAANNPNGFVYLPGVGYTRTLPNGVVEFLA
jgi:hypothetical protein